MSVIETSYLKVGPHAAICFNFDKTLEFEIIVESERQIDQESNYIRLYNFLEISYIFYS